MTKLLVSVREAGELASAIAGGADWIDVKEPSRGPLGRADVYVIEDIAQTIRELTSGGVRLSVAMGECHQALALPSDAMRIMQFITHHGGVVKAGTAATAPANWQHALSMLASHFPPHSLVVCAYADAERVGAVAVHELIHWAIEQAPTLHLAGILIDTAIKDGRGLFAWCSPDTLQTWIASLRAAGLWCALAGELRGEQVQHVVSLCPDLVAVRGAACADHDRTSSICAIQVRSLRAMIDDMQANVTLNASG